MQVESSTSMIYRRWTLDVSSSIHRTSRKKGRYCVEKLCGKDSLIRRTCNAVRSMSIPTVRHLLVTSNFIYENSR